MGTYGNHIPSHTENPPLFEREAGFAGTFYKSTPLRKPFRATIISYNTIIIMNVTFRSPSSQVDSLQHEISKHCKSF